LSYFGTLRILTILIIALAATCNMAWAGPPFATDDPEPVEYQHWEVNYAITKSWSAHEASASLPNIDINYGLSSDIQLHLQPAYSYERSGRDARYGFDNTEIGVKYRFFNRQYADSSIMVGIYPIVQLPTGDTRLGPSRGKTQAFLPIWIQRNSEKWTLYGGGGYRINQGVGSKNSIFIGATALYRVTDDFQLGGEVFHETPDTVDGENSTGFKLGGIYNMTDDYHLLFSAGKTLSNDSSTNQLSAYLALQVMY
jgi:hypothetical protein